MFDFSPNARRSHLAELDRRLRLFQVSGEMRNEALISDTGFSVSSDTFFDVRE